MSKRKTPSSLKVPVDEGCSLAAYSVFIDRHTGVIYDAALNQTNSGNNNNKFYRIQLLQGPGGSYYTWTRWGRVGDRGQNSTLGNGSFSDAMMQFEKKFKDKTGLTWNNRQQDPKPKKYVFVERSYVTNSEDEEDSQGNDQPVRERRKSGGPTCTLDPSVQSLMELIFNEQYTAATMDSFNYDAKKMPLGKLSKATITRGFQALKDLSALIAQAAGTIQPSECEALSNLYYSLIPHAFPRTQRPPIISTQDMLKREAELLESLNDLKNADEIVKRENDEDKVHPLDARFKALGLEEMTPLAAHTAEFHEIHNYLIKTCGETHSFDFEVKDIFRIERYGELHRFQNSKYAKVASHRRLLWHGSRATNYGGILGQGLRIAPPEAPVSGYMFEKGIYLADMSSKSANYCYSKISDGEGLLLLCEAELGDPMQVLQEADYDAAAKASQMGAIATWGQGETGPVGWKDAGCVHKNLKGVMMPDTSDPPGLTKVENAHLYYNEYICYDVAQVRLRYLLRVAM